MRLQTKAILAAVILANASNAFAASTADLRVIGTVIPGACTPVFAGGAVIDYGKISAGDLSPTANSSLQSRQIAYTITCDAPIVIGTSWIDNRTATAISTASSAFGLGTQGTNNIGMYSLRTVPSQTMADGGAVATISSDNGSIWSTSDSVGNIVVHGAAGRVFSFAPQGSLVPTAYTNYSGVMAVRVTIAPTNTLDMTAPIVLDGLSTMEVRYL